jgi:hypothetical protein
LTGDSDLLLGGCDIVVPCFTISSSETAFSLRGCSFSFVSDAGASLSKSATLFLLVSSASAVSALPTASTLCFSGERDPERGIRPGLNRERLAFVGDWYEARLLRGVVCPL